MRISIGCDHGGFNLKQQVVKYLQEKYEVVDYGCQSLESCDYPVFAKKVANDVATKASDFGVLICTTGIGMSITANKFKGVRAANFLNEEDAVFTTADDDINVLTLGSNNVDSQEAIRIVRKWLGTQFKGGRYQERIEMIKEIEKENMK